MIRPHEMKAPDEAVRLAARIVRDRVGGADPIREAALVMSHCPGCSYGMASDLLRTTPPADVWELPAPSASKRAELAARLLRDGVPFITVMARLGVAQRDNALLDEIGMLMRPASQTPVLATLPPEMGITELSRRLMVGERLSYAAAQERAARIIRGEQSYGVLP